ncbi:MAG: N-acyl homoserine lactonase family protein [Paucimonas sp.]|nr:N-acyl homoserine lactonase family protein [Paucimonas sp.]
MKMHILSGGRLRMKKSVYLPDAERSETIDLPVSCFLLRHPQGNVLFDTGCHPSTVDDAEARWGAMARAMVPIGGAQENVVDQLKLVGLAPDDIDVVVNSHFHSDHCGCNEFFRRATVVCHADELAAATAADADKRGYLPVDWKQPMPIETITGQRDLFNDGRIVLLPVPGHTVGMTAALVGLDKSGEFLLASDAVALRANLARDLNPRNTWDAELSSKSMQEVRRIEAGGSTVIFGHDDEQWKTLKTGAEFYD